MGLIKMDVMDKNNDSIKMHYGKKMRKNKGIVCYSK